MNEINMRIAEANILFSTCAKTGDEWSTGRLYKDERGHFTVVRVVTKENVTRLMRDISEVQLWEVLLDPHLKDDLGAMWRLRHLAGYDCGEVDHIGRLEARVRRAKAIWSTRGRTFGDLKFSAVVYEDQRCFAVIAREDGRGNRCFAGSATLDEDQVRLVAALDHLRHTEEAVQLLCEMGNVEQADSLRSVTCADLDC